MQAHRRFLLLWAINLKEAAEEAQTAEGRATLTTKDLKMANQTVIQPKPPVKTEASLAKHKSGIMITTLLQERKELSARSLKLMPLARLAPAIRIQKPENRLLPLNRHRHQDRLKR